MTCTLQVGNTRMVAAEDFLRAGAGASPQAKSGKPDAATAAEINEQMKKIWKIK